MKLFFSISLILVISIIDFFCVSNQRWFLLAISLVILVFFGFVIYKEINYYQLGALLLLFLLVITSFWWQQRPIQKQHFEPYQESSIYTIKEKFSNSLIISNQKNKRIFTQNYKLKNIFGKRNINLGDQFQATIFVDQKVKLKENQFDLFLASKKTYLKGKIIHFQNSTLKQYQNIRNHLISHFQNSNYQNNKDWILFLIFQTYSPSFETHKNKIYNLGIAHLFVISGFHLAVIGAIWFFIANKCQKQWAKYSFIACGLFFCTFLTYLTNWKISAFKSLIFLIFNLGLMHCLKLKRKPEKTELTALLGFCFLIFNPLFFYQLEFQLSFLAGWSLNFISQNLSKKKKHQIGKIFKTNLFVWIVVFPVIINLTFRFHFLSPLLIFFYGCWALVFYPLFFGLIWIPFLNSVFTIIFQSIQWSFNVFDQMFFYIPFGEMTSIYIFIHYFCLILLIFLSKWIGKPSKNFLLSFLIIFLVFGSNIWRNNFYHFHMIDVEHGLSMFLQSPDKKTNILFDAGSGRFFKNNTRKISNFLKKNHVKTLDAVFISHNHRDHYNNLEYLNKNFNIKKIFTNVNQKNLYSIKEIILKNLAINFNHLMNNENNRGLILQFEINNEVFLLMFDAEEEAEIALLNEQNYQKTRFLQVGHHGSKTSSTSAFLRATNPEYCLVSTGKEFEQHEKFEKAKCKVYNTYKKGSISILLTKPFQIKLEKSQ